MKKHSPSKPEKPTEPEAAARNQGEGDAEAAARFNAAEQQFVASAEGQKLISEAGQVDPAEHQELEEAVRDGLARAKGEDPAVTRKR